MKRKNSKNLKILYVGDLNEYGRGFQRYETLIGLGREVFGISHTEVPWSPRKNRSLIEVISWRLKIPVDMVGVNKKIKQEVLKDKFDVVWIEKGNTILPATLKFIKKHLSEAKLISVSEDDMYAKHNRSFHYMWGLKYYEVVFTTKTYNLEELKSLGAKRTELFLDSYSENAHKPIQLTDEEKARFSCDVSAIGAFEKERAESLLYLAEHGVKVAVWGSGWDAWINRHKNLDVKNKFLFGSDYAKAISATKINLNFLRKINRDEVTSRSVEIPACGGFMLGERTKRHLEFFEEGKEAEFFSSNEEMFKKVKYYLEREEERKRIASAGRERCLKSGYSMKSQLSKMLEKTL
ncbi:MAG: glycosyltransferase [bacterium]|nr:glycosyltransferase [bacterium]